MYIYIWMYGRYKNIGVSTRVLKLTGEVTLKDFVRSGGVQMHLAEEPAE